MRRLERDFKRGRRLDWRPGRELEDCRKLYFDEEDEPHRHNFQRPKTRPSGPRFRIVYKLCPTDDRATYIYILAVGAKADGVYDKAAERQRDSS
jgi:hypothetical protein